VIEFVANKKHTSIWVVCNWSVSSWPPKKFESLRFNSHYYLMKYI